MLNMLIMDTETTTSGISSFCAQSANIWQLVGYVVLVFRIAIPLLLIILGMVDLGRAVVSSDEKQISKSIGVLVRRFVAAIVIFFLPSLIDGLFGLIGLINTKDQKNTDYKVCYKCVTNATGSTCQNAVDALETDDED